jgi:RNA polymerase sigma-70 factor (ECF subfamily)
MTRDEFAKQVVSLQDTLYRVSYSFLPNPYDQDDAVQEAIRIALQKRETLREDRYLKTWIIRILINVCYGLLRKKKKELPTEIIEVVIPSTSDTTVMEALLKQEERFRLPLVLHHIEGYTTKEVSHILRIPEGTVKARLVRGRSLLKTELLKGGIGYEGAY